MGERRRFAELLRRHLSPEMMEDLERDVAEGKLSRPRPATVSVVVTRLAGIASVASQEELLPCMAGEYYTAVVDAMIEGGGDVEATLRMRIQTVFGMFRPYPKADAAIRASLDCLDRAHKSPAFARLRKESSELGVGIGIATGRCIAASLGGRGRIPW